MFRRIFLKEYYEMLNENEHENSMKMTQVTRENGSI